MDPEPAPQTKTLLSRKGYNTTPCIFKYSLGVRNNCLLPKDYMSQLPLQTIEVVSAPIRGPHLTFYRHFGHPYLCVRKSALIVNKYGPT